MRKRLKVGFDFDGVIAYNPFRLVRAPVAYFKRNILGVKGLKFYYPQTTWSQFIWRIMHDSSMFPSRGINLLKQLVEEERIEAHLITARYSFLDDHLFSWLDKYSLKKLFKSINLNKNDKQPHLFKEELIKKYKLDIFVEDNLDIVKHLDKACGARIVWIYNLLDKHYPYQAKHPHLEGALEDIVYRSKIRVQRSKPSDL